MPAPADETVPASPREQALKWFVSLRSGDALPSDHAAFQVWLAASPVHRIEYERLADIWRDLDALPDPRAGRPPIRPTRRHLLQSAGTAAGLALVTGAAVLADWPGAWSGDRHRTATGEQKTIVAADGSRIDLDAGSAVSIDYTRALRRVRLIRGRAQFTVAGDAARPFEVGCAEGSIRAMGTVFVVHRRPDDVMVSVQESAVAVSLSPPGAAEARLVAGQRLIYGITGLGPVEAADEATETAWRRGRLVFEDAPLGTVIADLNRYRPGRVMLWDDALAGLRVNGTFDLTHPDAALAAVVRILPVRAVELTRYLTLLRPA